MLDEETELLQPNRKKSTLPSQHLLFSVCVIGINALTLGYDAACMNDALGLIKKHYSINSTQLGIIDASSSLFAGIGALVGASFADIMGRRNTLAFSGAFYSCGAAITSLSFNWFQVVIGRSLCGLAVGFSFCSGK